MSRKGRSESPPVSLTHFTQSEYRDLQKDVRKIKTNKFEIAKNMPPKKHKTTDEFDIQYSEVVNWLVEQKEIKHYVFNKARSLGVIEYDNESKMWAGINNRNGERKMYKYRLSHVDGEGRLIQKIMEASHPDEAIAKFKKKFKLHWNAHVLVDLVGSVEDE